ncbi:MAG: hypothetical protein U0Z26_03895 [Anaerolineales bacterium]
MNNADERNVDPIQEMLHLMYDFSDLTSYGFVESFRSTSNKILIYSTEKCKIKFVWGGWDQNSGNSISIYYGRLHAPNESPKMLWNNEECYAWHGFEHALHFLDGRSIDDAVKMNFLTPITAKYYDDEYSKKYYRRQPEWLMQMHMDVWKQYNKSLFELFDLRQPNLWEEYRVFLKNFYDIKGRPPFIKPAMDKVC